MFYVFKSKKKIALARFNMGRWTDSPKRKLVPIVLLLLNLTIKINHHKNNLDRNPTLMNCVKHLNPKIQNGI